MIKVLLVDDHELVRTGVRSILEEAADIEVIGEASSGDDALKSALKYVDSSVVRKYMLADWRGVASTPFAELSSREMQVATELFAQG
jgi:CheY-like chemotaxis protein